MCLQINNVSGEEIVAGMLNMCNCSHLQTCFEINSSPTLKSKLLILILLLFWHLHLRCYKRFTSLLRIPCRKCLLVLQRMNRTEQCKATLFNMPPLSKWVLAIGDKGHLSSSSHQHLCPSLKLLRGPPRKSPHSFPSKHSESWLD